MIHPMVTSGAVAKPNSSAPNNVAIAGAEVILISGYDGGTGAANQSSIHHAGLPWEIGFN